MTHLYENQYIGAFIYTLGVEGGKEGKFPASINLIQQTPLDKKIGDLFGNWNGRNFFWSISSKGHFICYGKESIRKDTVELIFRNYVSLAGHISDPDTINNVFGLEAFIFKMIKSQIGMNQYQMIQYLKVLDRITTGASDFSGLIVRSICYIIYIMLNRELSNLLSQYFPRHHTFHSISIN
ncbi:hypothetical protein [Fulvivirga sediminis]|uniref:Uncharacterized protein n=1 Tax=Fulvivirga sediminis TaxID=2803949 RepID=A0A937JZD2_9BACT|nr:hypothetical protein [Fulvivirga sediminis]MBL3657293.1 hypothetical protein [Fulvivirga sediminis]